MLKTAWKIGNIIQTAVHEWASSARYIKKEANTFFANKNYSKEGYTFFHDTNKCQ